MFLAQGSINTDIETIPKLIADMKIRRRWETQLFDMEVFDDNEDHTDCKTFYVFKAPMGVADREFMMIQV